MEEYHQQMSLVPKRDERHKNKKNELVPKSALYLIILDMTINNFPQNPISEFAI